MIPPELAELGLSLIEDFATPEEETAILQQVPPTPPRLCVQERNSIRRFGSQSAYRTNVVGKFIPESISVLCRRLHQQKILDFVAHSITVNEYQKGQQIAPHIDEPRCGPVIAVLSMCSPATMRLTSNTDSYTIVLPPRSLVVMKDEIRYQWRHSVEPVEELRMSVVFRKE
jgi:alkylated DNA repair dioxygenase AlkB